MKEHLDQNTIPEMEKHPYATPVTEIIRFENEDVITTSGLIPENEGGGDEKYWNQHDQS